MIERSERAQVDDLSLDSLFGELGGGFKRNPDADRIADERDIATFAHDFGLADRQDEVIQLRHLETLAVEQLVFQKDHRVLRTDRSLHQSLGVSGRPGRDDDQPRSEEHTSELQSLMPTSYA